MLGVDSTDSPRGGCTTFTASKIIDQLFSLDQKLEFNDFPNLIRLNPNISSKTRGNAAIAIHFTSNLNRDIIFTKLKEIVEQDFLKYKSNDEKFPGLVLVPDTDQNKEIYVSLLQRLVSLNEISKSIPDALIWPEKSSGLIGAIGAINANLQLDHTYELIAYRVNECIGQPRKLEFTQLPDLISRYPSTFSSYDFERQRELIAPSGLDPVFFGIRGTNFHDLISFYEQLNKEEPVQSYTVFKTNQGTDAHVYSPFYSRLSEEVVSSMAKIIEYPVEIQGGHVKLMLEIQGDVIVFMAFEPTKKLRSAAKMLIPGDMIFIHGNLRINEFGLNGALEYFEILHLQVYYKKSPPQCECGSQTTSQGKFKGFRCKQCGKNHYSPKMDSIERKLYIGQKVYASPSAQRHLTRPITRLHARNRTIPKNVGYAEIRKIFSPV